jgi:epoxyqueuosine reductase
MSPGGMAKAELKAALVRRATELGFDACRVTTAEPPASAPDFERALAEGRHAEMAWLAKAPEKRADLSRVLPGIRSVVTVAISYHRDPHHDPSAQTAAPGSATRGIVARYAQHPDYHDLLKEPLRALTEFLDTEARVTQRSLWYVDTGPILERDFASDAGLGWNGKSTVQIHPKLGTWFFLGEILTTLPVPPDQPFGDHCGKCTRCMTACPTQAITAPRQMDARRCLSYLTIEHKGSIPLEFRKPLGNRIYGCDDCLAVCPWNRFAQASKEAAFAARDYVHGWTLRKFLSLNDDDFRTLFKGSPIKRLKRDRFLRNVCVALGNTGSRDDIPALQTAAADADPLIVEHALWAIAEIRHRG